MAKTLYNSKGLGTQFVKITDVQKLKMLEYNVYNEFGIANPIEGFKKIYKRIPANTGYPIFIFLGCGAMYTTIAQKVSDDYLSCIIFGYAMNQIILLTKNKKLGI